MNSITKRLLSITAACTLCFSASPLTANADTYYYKGDVNNSGSVCNFGRRIDSNVLHFIYNNDELN